jgi:hypothetical protein
MAVNDCLHPLRTDGGLAVDAKAAPIFHLLVKVGRSSKCQITGVEYNWSE